MGILNDITGYGPLLGIQQQQSLGPLGGLLGGNPFAQPGSYAAQAAAMQQQQTEPIWPLSTDYPIHVRKHIDSVEVKPIDDIIPYEDWEHKYDWF